MPLGLGCSGQVVAYVGRGYKTNLKIPQNSSSFSAHQSLNNHLPRHSISMASITFSQGSILPSLTQAILLVASIFSASLYFLRKVFLRTQKGSSYPIPDGPMGLPIVGKSYHINAAGFSKVDVYFFSQDRSHS